MILYQYNPRFLHHLLRESCAEFSNMTCCSLSREFEERENSLFQRGHANEFWAKQRVFLIRGIENSANGVSDLKAELASFNSTSPPNKTSSWN